MTIVRRIFAGVALVIAASSLASADSVASFTSTFPSSTTDVINGTLTIAAFDPGVNGIPLNAVLDFWTLSVTETITGTINITNSTANTFQAGAEFGVSTQGALSIGTALSGDGQPDGLPGDASNDIFGGSGPNPSTELSVAGLAPTQSTGAQPYTSSRTVTTGDIFTPAPEAPPDPLTLFFSTYTLQNSAGLGGNGTNVYTDNVSLSATISYDYSIPSSTPEPATLALMGGALLGIGMLHKRLKKS